MDAVTRAVAGRATRAWVPPVDLWLVDPRSDNHAGGGWYFELPPGPPRPPRRSRRRRETPRRFPGTATGEKHVWEEFREDFRSGSGFGSGLSGGDSA